MNLCKSTALFLLLVVSSLSKGYGTIETDPFLTEVENLKQRAKIEAIDLTTLVKAYPLPEAYDEETNALWLRRFDKLEMLLYVNFSIPGLGLIAKSQGHLGLAIAYLQKTVRFNRSNPPYNEMELNEAIFTFYNGQWTHFKSNLEKTITEIQTTDFDNLTFSFLMTSRKNDVKRICKRYFEVLPSTKIYRPEWDGVAEVNKPQILNEIKYNLTPFHTNDLQYFAWTAHYLAKRDNLLNEIYEFANGMHLYLQTGQNNPEPLPPVMDWINELSDRIRISLGA